MNKPHHALLTVVLLVVSLLVACSPKDPVILATTTSPVDSGLLDVLAPMFKTQTGYEVKTVSVGTGQALAMGARGDADVLLVHSPAAEEILVTNGVAINRKYVMYNDFVVVGPSTDPAGIRGMTSAAEGLKAIMDKEITFVSRGDNSGTHLKEKELWQSAKLAPRGTWYIEAGTGMSATLAIAEEKQGYTLADRGTYLAYKKNLSLVILLEGDTLLKNPYHVMQISHAKFSHVNSKGAKAFVEFMLSKDAQGIIATFGKDKFGEPLFFPGHK